ncbi:hypothetical protein BCV43_20950 [Vibrio cyclitrophicus]
MDNGKGITKDDLTSEQNVFNLGYRPAKQGLMNEHGFGLKNALAMLTSGFQTNFSLYSRVRNEPVYKVSGPIQELMEYTEISDLAEWDDYTEALKGIDSGVKIFAEVKKEYFETIDSRSKNFDTYVRRLGEHLGIMYHRYIDSGNKIVVRYKSMNSKEWTNQTVPAIKVPFLTDSGVKKVEETIRFENDGKKYSAVYTQGVLDKKYKDTSAESEFGWPFPLRSHYQGSHARCGVTLIVRDRVIKTGIFKEIWPQHSGDVSFNNFVGELRVDSDFDTTNNKTDLDPHSAEWRLLRNELQENFVPDKTTKKQSEESLRKKISKIIGLVHKIDGAEKPAKKVIWGGGAEVDIYFRVDGLVRLMELKIEQARVRDVYQLVMYWDGVVNEENESPFEATLVAASCPTQVEVAIQHVNQLKDHNGNKYNIRFESTDNYNSI